MNGGDFEL